MRDIGPVRLKDLYHFTLMYPVLECNSETSVWELTADLVRQNDIIRGGLHLEGDKLDLINTVKPYLEQSILLYERQLNEITRI